MSGMNKALCAAVSMVALTACQTYEPVLDAGGPTNWEKERSNAGNYDLFRQSHDVANAVASGKARIPLPDPAAPPPVQARGAPPAPRSTVVVDVRNLGEDPAARKMLAVGFDLLANTCQDFFAEAGRNQGRVNFTRDLVVVGAGLVGSAMALNPRNERSMVALPITTGAIYGGIDAYNANFLFGADNIAEVRILTIEAVSTHQDLWNAKLEGKSLTYSGALRILNENQQICMGPEILRLVKAAIKAGKVKEKASAAPPPPEPAPGETPLSRDGAKDLGKAVGASGSITENEAAALYWLYQSTGQDHTKIAAELASLQDSPFTSGAFDPDWDREEAVEKALAALSDRDRDRLLAIIQGWNTPAAAAPLGPPPPPSAPLTSQNVGTVALDVQ